MTRDEYILLQFRDNIKFNRALFIWQAIAGVGGLFLVVAAVVMGRGLESLAIVPAIMYLFAASGLARSKAEAFEAGLEEIEADPVDIVRAYRLSPETAELIESTQLSHKTLFSLIVSYGIMAILLVAVSAVCLAFWDNGLIYFIAGSITLMMGAGMIVLTVKAIRNWILVLRMDKDA